MSWIDEADILVPNVVKAMSINIPVMEAVQNLNAAISSGNSALTRVQEEAIATVVSAINNCRY